MAQIPNKLNTVMREFIDIVENTLSGMFYHASNAKLSVGDVLRPRGDLMLDGDVDEIVERNRPSNRPNRNSMVFMVRNPRDLENVAIDQDHLYLVVPSNDVFWADHAWINAIWHEIVSNGDDGNAMTNEIYARCDQYAKAYWDGKLSRFGRDNPSSIEWMASSARIRKVLK